MGDWQISVIGMSGGGSKMVSIARNEDDFYATTVQRLMELVLKHWEGDFGSIDNMRLIFAGKQLQKKSVAGDRELTLDDYDIKRNSTIQVVTRVPGGQDAKYPFPRPRTPTEDRVHIKGKTTMNLSTSQSDVIYGYSEEDDPPRVQMSCGHYVDPTRLFSWCRSLLDSKKSEFYCPAEKCKKVWEYSEVRQAALLTLEECQYFESKMSQNHMAQTLDLNSCPRCQMICERQNRSVIITNCPACTVKLKKTYEFCWQCGKEWTGDRSSSALKCGNPDCEHPSLPALKKAKMITKYGCTFPNIRACPTCGAIVEHTGVACKFATCPQCKLQYCFLCLKTESECLNTVPGGYHKACSVPVAPQQTVIPKWSK